MMRLTAFALVRVSTAVHAQPETVVVERNRGLEGLWKISVPAGFSVSFGGPAKFGPMRDVYCRITQDDAIRCLNGGYAESGTAEMEGDAVHIAWGSMMARMTIDATYKDGSLNGIFAFKLGGIRHNAPERSIGERIVPRSGSDEASKYLADILTQLSAGRISLPLDNMAIKAHRGAIPQTLES